VQNRRTIMMEKNKRLHVFVGERIIANNYDLLHVYFFSETELYNLII